MGSRGPAKTPTPLLKLVGSRLVDQREDEPQPDVGWPDQPDGLTDDAKTIWNQLLPQLEKIGVLTVVDGSALGRYCELYVRWWRANAFIAKHGETYPLKNEDGSLKYVQQFPQVSISCKLHTALLRIEQEFGLTPAARAGLKVERPKEDDLERKYG